MGVMVIPILDHVLFPLVLFLCPPAMPHCYTVNSKVHKILRIRMALSEIGKILRLASTKTGIG